MPSRVFVTGGSGFVGRAVVGELLGRSHTVIMLDHRGAIDDLIGRVTPVRGDLFDDAALGAGMAGCDAVVHLVGIIFEKPAAGVTFERIHHEGTRRVVDAARRAGVRRYAHMSALGTRPGAASAYHRTKYEAEQYVRASGLEWTIFRPAMIHGPRGDFMGSVARWARRRAAPFLFMPYFGAGPLGLGGAGKLQPVFVDDVARAFADALDDPGTVGKSYDLAGPDVLTWPELHRAAARAIVGHGRWVVPIPAWYARLLTRLVPGRLLPFNRDQVAMSQEDNTADLAPFTADFGWQPRPFRETLETYAGQM
jgi:NADH dehydrogenase